MSELPILVSTGTWVPPTPIVKIPSLLRIPLHLWHQLGLVPPPDRCIAELAYGSLKRLGDCQVQTLSWLGLDERKQSLKLARRALRQLLVEDPYCRVVLVGQEQGGLIMAELATEPEFEGEIAAVVFDGVPWLGIEATKRWYLKRSTVSPGVTEMGLGHPSLVELGQRLEQDLPPGIVVVVAASPRDELVPLESAMGVNFPDGTDVRRYLIDDQQPDDLEQDMKYLHRGGRDSLAKVVAELREELLPQSAMLQAA